LSVLCHETDGPILYANDICDLKEGNRIELPIAAKEAKTCKRLRSQ
jgi:hypothetical protein